jgi:hypothetical protein
MQALKQAAREGDQVRLEALCDAWQVSAGADHHESDRVAAAGPTVNHVEKPVTEKAEDAAVSAAGVEIRR